MNGHPLIWLDNAAHHSQAAERDRRDERVLRPPQLDHPPGRAYLGRAFHGSVRGWTREARRFLNAPSKDDIVFLRGTTEAINLVATLWGRANIGPGDEIIVSTIEHHANIVPWQLLAQSNGARSG